MSRPNRCLKDSYEEAVSLVENGVSFRTAVTRIYETRKLTLSSSVLFRRYHTKKEGNKNSSKSRGRKPVLTELQEREIAKTCRYFAVRGVPIIREEISDLVHLCYGHLPRVQSCFKNGRPGKKWLKSFCKRLSYKFSVPSKQQAERFRSTNAEVISNHLLNLEEVMKEYEFDARRIFNLDETGMSAGRDTHGASKKRAVVPSKIRCHVKGADFEGNLARVSLLACISAAGEAVCPLWVFKGTRLPFRVIRNENGEISTQSAAHLLPPDSLLGTRKEKGGIDSSLFAQWAEYFVRTVRHLTNGNRKVLLIYDACRAHMTLHALSILRKGNIEVYALPAHTSGFTQPLDISVFSPFKTAVNETLYKLGNSLKENNVKVTLYNMCDSFRAAYYSTFNRENITSGFKNAGIWPLNPNQLFRRPLPKSYDDIETIIETCDLIKMLEKMRGERRQNTAPKEIQSRAGFVDTRNGLILTCASAMKAAEVNEKAARIKKLGTKLKKSQKEVRKQMKLHRKKQEKRGPPTEALKARAIRLDVPVECLPVPRSMDFRRALARERALRRWFDEESRSKM